MEEKLICDELIFNNAVLKILDLRVGDHLSFSEIEIRLISIDACNLSFRAWEVAIANTHIYN